MSQPSTPDTPQPALGTGAPAEGAATPDFLPAADPTAQPAQAPIDPQAYPSAAPHPAADYPASEQPEPAEAPTSAGPENVGRGLLFSLLAIVLGAVLAALIFQLGFIASITSFAMAWAAGWLYTKGAGAPPKKGVAPLIAVIVVGVIVSLFVILGWALYGEIAAEFPGAGFGEIMPFVMQLLFDVEVWSNFARDAGMFVLFAALGTFTTLRQLSRNATA